MEYKLSAASTWKPAAEPEITGLTAGTYNVRFAAKPGYSASPATNVTVPAFVPASQPAPTGLVGVAPTEALNDGKITGTTAAMEYKLSAASTWKPAAEPEITGLTAGTYNVRFAAKLGYSAGAIANVTVPAFVPASQPAPTGLVGVAPTAALNDGKITGTTVAMEYKLSTASTWKPAAEPEITSLTASTYNVRFTAKPGYSASPATNVTVPAYATQTPAAKLLFTFDDGWKDTRTNAFPILSSAGFKGTIYICRDITNSGQSNIMNVADLNALYSNGWDLSNHTTNHLDYLYVDGKIVIPYVEVGSSTDPEHLAAMETVYRENQEWLLANGWTRGAYHVAYPSGLYSDPLIEILKGMGVLTGRATIENEDHYNNQTIPVTNFFKLPVQYVETEARSENLIAVKEAIDYAVAHGTTLFLMLHKVAEKDGDLVVTDAELTELVAYAKARTDANQLSVMTISEWYASQVSK
jgi:peptidoglycan/xylan/chitin deacetylase (PgdA/CDA1 family)